MKKGKIKMTYNKMIEIKKAIGGLAFLVERIQGQREYIEFWNVKADLLKEVETMPDGMTKEHNKNMILYYENQAVKKVERLTVKS